MHPIEEYKNVMKRMLRLSFPSLYEEELDKAIDYSVQKRFKDADCRIFNNYKESEASITLSKLTDYIASKKPIVTAFGVLFSRHGDVINPYYKFIEELGDLRAKYKKEMFKHPKGSELFNKYNLLQLLAKIDMNA